MIKLLRFFLLPFAILFFIASEFRNFLFQSRIMRGAKFDRPVITIGNLSTGGTGKTPMIEYLIRLSKKNAIKPSVLSRGYGRKLPGFRIVNTGSVSNECGDEPLQIKQKFPEVDVAVCERRVDGIILMIKEVKDIQVIFLDDAFQHRAVKPSFSVLTTSFYQPFFTDFILPVGDLREMRRNASRANVIVVTKCPDWMTEVEMSYYKRAILRYSKAQVFFSRISYGAIKPVFDGGKPIALTHHVLLVSGIAATQSLEEYLKERCSLKHLKFNDHHQYNEKDIRKIADIFDSFANGDKIILTTEKDAKRFQSMGGEMMRTFKSLPVYFIEMEMEIINEKEKFDQLILEHVRSFE